MEHRSLDDLRQALARAGVPLFAAPDACDLAEGDLAALIEDLARHADPRLVAALPCVIVRHAAAAARLVDGVAIRLDAAAARRLALLYRCARALAISREPDLDHLFGHAIVVESLAIEPVELPDPAADFGERFLAIAGESDESGTVGDAEATFDTWLRQLEVERVTAADA